MWGTGDKTSKAGPPVGESDETRGLVGAVWEVNRARREWWGKPGWTGSQGESLGEDIRAERPAMEEQKRGHKKLQRAWSGNGETAWLMPSDQGHGWLERRGLQPGGTGPSGPWPGVWILLSSGKPMKSLNLDYEL